MESCEQCPSYTAISTALVDVWHCSELFVEIYCFVLVLAAYKYWMCCCQLLSGATMDTDTHRLTQTQPCVATKLGSVALVRTEANNRTAWTEKQMSRTAGQMSRTADDQKSRWDEEQMSRKANEQKSRWAEKQMSRRACEQKSRKPDEQKSRWAGEQMSRRSEEQNSRWSKSRWAQEQKSTQVPVHVASGINCKCQGHNKYPNRSVLNFCL